jgi:lysophospholipase L1-like esterase
MTERPRLSLPRKLVFSLVAVLLVAGGVELGARVVESSSPPSRLPEPTPGACGEGQDCVPGAAPLPARSAHAIPLVERPRAGWGFEPGSRIMHGNLETTINSLGLRGPELPEAKPADELRLMSLGDSTVYGYGVAEREIFGAVAASELAQRLGRPVRHVNGALPGYDSRQAMLVLQDTASRVQPDWLIIACMWSDLFHAPRDPAAGPALPLASYRLLVRALGPWLPPRTIGWWDPEQDVGTPGLGRSPRTSLAQYMDNLHALAALGQEHGARSVFVALPAPIDLDPAPTPEYIQDYRAAMYTVARALDAPFVDGPDRFERAGATAAMFFDQVHPSAPGHALLGQAVAEVLAERSAP